MVLRTQISEVKFAVSSSVQPKATNTYIIRSAVSGAPFLHDNANMSVLQSRLQLETTTGPPLVVLTAEFSGYVMQQLLLFFFYNITLIANIVMHHNYLSQVSVYDLRKQRLNQSIIISK